MLTFEMVSDLRCPACSAGSLRAEVQKQEGDAIIEGRLVCHQGDETYPIVAGVPSLIPERVLDDTNWRTWQDHLEVFQERREQRVKHPDRWINRWSKYKSKKKRLPLERIPSGKVLDVGCGPGKFRFSIGGPDVIYYGLDPIVVPEVQEFPFVQALSEYIPFKDNTFSHVFVKAALDHFNNLDAFFSEASRVLRPDGRLHIIQSVHDAIRGPISATKMFTHWIKDHVEDRATNVKNTDTPHHISEWNTSSLHQTLTKYFEVEAERVRNVSWYRPTKLLITLRPNQSLPGLTART